MKTNKKSKSALTKDLVSDSNTKFSKKETNEFNVVEKKQAKKIEM